MVGQPRRNFIKLVSWSKVSEHLVNLIRMRDQPKRNNQFLDNFQKLYISYINLEDKSMCYQLLTDKFSLKEIAKFMKNVATRSLNLT